jgi:signal transduction histidine kinase
VVTLESSKLFGQLPPGELNALRTRTREVSYPAGQDIFREGDPGDGVYLVKSGLVQIWAVLVTGERKVFSQVPPGEVFGEMSLLDSQPRSAGASAEEDTVVCFVPRDAMVELLKRLPELSMNLVQEISGRLREFNRHYLREVLRAERMALVGRFASSIVHDLKNPLAIISFATDMACLDQATVEARKTAQARITRQVERITSMVNDILEFTHGTVSPPTFSRVDYGTFVRPLVEEFRKEVEYRSVVIEYANEPPAVKLPINPHRLTRVFHNLIVNAVEAMPEGGRIRLRFDVADAEVTTEVADTGPGIPAEIADRLFEAFATHGKPRGTGLGLSSAKRIIQEHEGAIAARNPPEGGAAFAFTLPRARKTQSAIRQA